MRQARPAKGLSRSRATAMASSSRSIPTTIPSGLLRSRIREARPPGPMVQSRYRPPCRRTNHDTVSCANTGTCNSFGFAFENPLDSTFSHFMGPIYMLVQPCQQKCATFENPEMAAIWRKPPHKIPLIPRDLTAWTFDLGGENRRMGREERRYVAF